MPDDTFDMESRPKSQVSFRASQKSREKSFNSLNCVLQHSHLRGWQCNESSPFFVETGIG